MECGDIHTDMQLTLLKFNPVYCGLLFLLFSHSLMAMDAKPGQKTLTLSDIQQKIQAIKSRQNITEDLKNRLLTIYTESEENLNELQAQEAQAESFKQSMTSMPAEAKRIQKQILDAEESLKHRKLEKLAIFPTDEIEQRLIIEKTHLSDLDAEINRLESQVADQLNRPQLIREKIAEIKSRHQEQQYLANKSSDNSLEKEAKQVQLDTRIQMLNATLKTLERESISDPLRLQVQKDHMHLLNIQREMQFQLVAELDNALLERRQQSIDKEQAQLLEAEKAAEGKHPLIKEATQKNIKLNRNLQDINTHMEYYLQQKNDIESRFKQVEKDFQSAEQKINLAGLSPALGNLLREQRRNLPQRKQYTVFNETIQNEIAQASLENYRLDELSKNLLDVSSSLNQLLSQELAPDMSQLDKFQIRTELRLLLNDQKELAIRLSGLYTEYSRILGDVDFSLQQLLSASEKFSVYLDQRLLWVPSAPVINQDYLKDIFHSLIWFFTPNNWLEVVASFADSIKQMPFLILLGGILVAFHWRFSTDIRMQLNALLGEYKHNTKQAAAISSAILGIALVSISSLSLPLVLAWFGAVIWVNPDLSDFSRAFAEGCVSTAVSFAVIQFFYRFFKSEGVAETLLHWHSTTTTLLHQQLQWSRFILLPCIFITATTGSDIFSEHSYALGRTALIVLMLVIALIFHRFCHPKHGLAKHYYQAHNNWLSRFAYLWYAVALIVPLVIIGFAVAGYYQSALELQQKLINTVRLVFLTALIQTLVMRWFVIARRKLAEQTFDASYCHDALGVHDPKLSDTQPAIDLTRISQQSYSLLNTVTALSLLIGVWMIWRDILPAFSIIDHIELWQHRQYIDGKEQLHPTTLTNLLVALLYAGITLVLVINFPVLVDLSLTQRLSMTTGSRYAFIQIVRYLMISIAFLAIANELGGTWSQVQWLVAALGVGLGFGLQEIFANMVSGIILLFERPIRVGDTVTDGHVTGRVSRIQMRATHIVDLDRKELVVPNKTFITDQLINWTLSDTVTRIVVPVNVAYGTDIQLVEKLFLDVIKTTEHVLRDPEPSVLFNGFGDSCLHFDIQVFVHDMIERLTVTHNLHTNIYKTLQEHNILMPFPQREVHIKSIAAGIIPNS